MNEREIFTAAAKLNPDQRTDFLDAACGQDDALRRQVDELLSAHDDSHGPLPLTSNRDRQAEAQARRVHAEAGTLIGPYKLLEEIGEGGMGSVWVAEQFKPIRRKVAIKLIKLGMDSKTVLARFDAERQALAMMDHPNIARVLDGGVTDEGRPYFAMEYVKGVPLIDYCDNAKLSIRERLELFVPVCRAVQHAHQKGVIHRDLKPSNILVCLYDGKPVPKVIDFGLAKAMHQSLTEKTLYTAHGMMVGTPLYMSPEQAESNNLDVDTRTDIYSLGVLLYELLTGTTPLEKAQLKDAAVGEVLRLIKEVEPPKPSTRISASQPNVAVQRSIDAGQLARSVSGDLDWVVMKALEKERSRRYETADGLAEDVRRHLANEPVSAGPPSAAYRFAKLVKRNKRLFAAAAAVFVALSLGLVGTSWGLFSAARARSNLLAANARLDEALEEAKQQRMLAQQNESTAVAEAQRAERELTTSNEVRQLVRDMFYSITPDQARGQDITLLKDILDAAAERLSSGQIENDDVAAKMHNLIGFVYGQLGLEKEAESHYHSAIDLLEDRLGSDHTDVLFQKLGLAGAIGDQGRYAEAEELYRPLMADSEHAETPEELRLKFSVMNNFGLNLIARHRWQEAKDILERVLQLQRDEYGDDSIFVLPPMGNLAQVYKELGQLEKAEAICLEAAEILAALPEDAYEFSDFTTSPAKMEESLKSNLALIYMDQERYADAEPLLVELIDIYEKKYGDRYIHTLGGMTNLAVAYLRSERYEDARVYYEKSLERKRDALGMSHPWTGFAMAGLARTYRKLGLIDQARNLESELIDLLASDPPTMHWPAGVLDDFAAHLLRQELETIPDPAGVLAVAVRACELEEADRGANLGGFLKTRGKAHAAVGAWDQAIADYDRAGAENPDSMDQIRELRGRALAALGRWDNAADELIAAVKHDSSRQQAWLQLMPVLALADRREEYRRYCVMRLVLATGTNDPREADLVCKLAELIPDVSDANKLPIEVVSNSLEEGTAPRDSQPWLWACKALVAYRQDDAAAAIEFVRNSQASNPSERCRALGLSILALAEHASGNRDDANRALEDAQELFDRLQQAPANQGHHDVLVAQVLLREAEAKINGT